MHIILYTAFNKNHLSTFGVQKFKSLLIVKQPGIKITEKWHQDIHFIQSFYIIKPMNVQSERLESCCIFGDILTHVHNLELLPCVDEVLQLVSSLVVALPQLLLLVQSESPILQQQQRINY